jgi:hypothetical protein
MSVLLQPKRKDNKYSAYNHGINTDYPDQRERASAPSQHHERRPWDWQDHTARR